MQANTPPSAFLALWDTVRQPTWTPPSDETAGSKPDASTNGGRLDVASWKDDLCLLPIVYGSLVLSDTMAIDNRCLFELLDDAEYRDLISYLAKTDRLRVWARKKVGSFAQILEEMVTRDHPRPPMLFSSLSSECAADVQETIPKYPKPHRLKRFHEMTRAELDFKKYLERLDEIFISNGCPQFGWKLDPNDFDTMLGTKLSEEFCNDWGRAHGDTDAQEWLIELIGCLNRERRTKDRVHQPWDRTTAYQRLDEIRGVTKGTPEARTRTRVHNVIDTVYLGNFTYRHGLRMIDKIALPEGADPRKTGPDAEKSLGEVFLTPKHVQAYLDWRRDESSDRPIEYTADLIIAYCQECKIMQPGEPTWLEKFADMAPLIGSVLGATSSWLFGLVNGDIARSAEVLKEAGPGVFVGATAGLTVQQIVMLFKKRRFSKRWFYTRQEMDFLTAWINADDIFELRR